MNPQDILDFHENHGITPQNSIYEFEGENSHSECGELATKLEKLGMKIVDTNFHCNFASFRVASKDEKL